MNDQPSFAFTDRKELPLVHWKRFLSVREREQVSSYRHPARLERTIAARVITKFLFWQPAGPAFTTVGANEIETAGTADWSSLELLSGTCQNKTAPAIFYAGNRCAGVSASWSHCGSYTVSCVTRGSVGIDLERIEERRPEFYRHSFSLDEQDWAKRYCSQTKASPEAAFTLLWSVKEAYLKVSNQGDPTVWSFPRWTIWFDAAFDEILVEKPGSLVRLTGGVCTQGFVQNFEISAARIDQMMLAAVTIPDWTSKQ